MKRPVGITLIAMYCIVGGVISIILGVLMLIGSESVGISWHTLLSLITLVTGVFELIVFYGLWFLQKWSASLAVYLNAIYIFISFILIFTDSSFTNFCIQAMFIMISAVILQYLMKPEIKYIYQK